MSWTDSSGYYGSTTSLPSIHPKGIMGRTDGVNPTAGCIGEIVSTGLGLVSNFNNTGAGSDAYVNVTGPTSTISLTAGVWLILVCGATAITGASDAYYFSYNIYNQTDAAIISEFVIVNTVSVANKFYGGSFSGTAVVALTGTKTIGLQMKNNNTSASSYLMPFTRIFAVRIA